MVYSLPENLKQFEEIREHQELLKDLKHSRTLPILCPVSVPTLNLNDYWLWDLPVVTILPPKIILPSPSPLLKESEYFSFYTDKVNENTCESSPVEVMWSHPVALGSFSQELFSFHPIY